MNDTISINTLELRAVPDLYNKYFFIPDYQRGYRWGTRQVEQLMDDLTFFFEKGKGEFYCLQPIVVKAMSPEEVESNKLQSEDDENKWYEVIDGQQRLTTIRIILALFGKTSVRFNKKFTIKYKTRPSLGEIFDNFIYDYRRAPYSVVVDERYKDIDSWHIHQAANCVLKWLEKGEPQNKGLDFFDGTFKEAFTRNKNEDGKKSVQVIWYELHDDSEPTETFKRLNDKKVSLNNAELIRAMFLSDSAEYEYEEYIVDSYPEDVQEIVKEREQARKQAHIIEQWDIIEKQLRQPAFWAFVKNDASDAGYSCRIEYLFDLVTQRDEKEKDELFTYLRFEEIVKNKSGVKGLWSLWLKVESYFSTLLTWYHNREYYHKIGYLITEKGNSVLVELLDKSTKQTKSRFAKNIDWMIKQHIMLRMDDDIYSYSYDDGSQAGALKRILFYFNVESTRIISTLDVFPFEHYKKQNWTLEHIHAQNSERIDRNAKDKWKEWIRENIKVLEHLSKRFPEGDRFSPSKLITTLNEKIEEVEKSTFVFDDFARCFDSVNAYYNVMAMADGGTSEVHNISNLALLSGTVNTSISNSVFEVKRQLIMENDARGEYIPYCTRLVFLKYYNKDTDDFSVQQSFYWSEKDRANYLENIKAVLKPVLEAQDPDKENA
ncbi:MAG: DUF262 domain-containing protein [Bacteroidales bacterium]|nr:DUF262 domain-containing protein [Bacteroidales bacterium]